MRGRTPTRKNLHAVEDRIEFTARGHEVLKRKLEGLILEFMDVLDHYEPAHETLSDAYQEAQFTVDRVRAMTGEIALSGLAQARRDHPEITLTPKRIMGVALPMIEAGSISSDVTEHGYGLLGTSPVVDAVVDDYEAVLEQVVVVAEVQIAIQILLHEIQTTRNHVRALEKSILPKLRDDARKIRHHLDEREREERTRQKWFKATKRSGRGLSARSHADGEHTDS